MAVELKRLIEKVSHMDITCIAGDEGIHNIVSWVHMVETKEASTFLEGGEIAFSTGIGLSNSLSILELVENIWLHHASGVVLNTGPFLESIPQEVIEFGNEHDFPIYTVPWKIHLAEIMRIFCYAITKSDQANLEIAAAFKNAIFFPEHTELYMVPLSHYHFQADWNYYVCTIKITSSTTNELSTNTLESYCVSLENFLQHRQFKRYAMFYHEGQLITVLANYDDASLNHYISTITTHLEHILTADQKFHIGIGKCTKSIRCLYKSYHQALAIQNLQENNRIPQSLITYSNMGVYKILMGVEDKDILNEYYEKTIALLEDYDKKNESDLTLVLRCYLNHNGSVQETADELFVHRNTVNYKLSKAAEVLHMNLSKLDSRLQLLLGFMLQDML